MSDREQKRKGVGEERPKQAQGGGRHDSDVNQGSKIPNDGGKPGPIGRKDREHGGKTAK